MSQSFANVFAYPLPWRMGNTKGRAAYKKAQAVYAQGWMDSDADEQWTPAGNDLAAAIANKQVTAKRVLEDASAGRVLLARCNTRDEVMDFVQKHHYRASFAAATANEETLMAMENEFVLANKRFVK